MQTVVVKCERSQELINNLGSERTRWDESCEGFKTQMATIIGDCLVSGAFLTYLGFFDHFHRRSLIEEWRDALATAGIRFREDCSFLEFLSKPTERLVWQSNALPTDDLCVENAVILKYYNRYPLIIDPSGQALNYIMN